MQITAEIMQTYVLKKFAIAQSNCSTLLKTFPYNTTWSALHKHKWSDQNVEWPNRERQMQKKKSYRLVNPLLHLKQNNFAAK